ncbi:MAG: 50S ribosomal protein L15 [Actinomycetota bacterium]|nr:50S ribosomal protein L15 [Actinomycetota bacterium]
MARIEPEDVGLDNLRPKKGTRKNRKRVGRGHGSGMGKTSGRGHKGQGSRAGSKERVRHEGGQNPIHMRMRKLRGPNKKMSMPFEKFRTHTQAVNLATLEERFDDGAEVTPETLKAAGLATRRHPVKVLGNGDLTKKLTVRAHGFSKAAREKIESAGGSAETLDS